MNTSLKVPLLTKEGSGEVMQWRISNLPLAPSLEGVHTPDTLAPQRWSKSQGERKKPLKSITEPFGLRRPRLLRGHLEACPEPLEGPVPEFFSSLLRGGG